MQRPRLHRLIRYAALAVVPKSARQSVIARYLEEYNCMPPPVFIIIISLIEVAFFIYYCIVLEEVSAIGPVPWQSSLIYNPCRRDQVTLSLTVIFILKLYLIRFGDSERTSSFMLASITSSSMF